MRSVFSSKSFRPIISFGFAVLLIAIVCVRFAEAQVVFNQKIDREVQQVARNQNRLEVLVVLTEQPAFEISRQEKAVRENILIDLETQLDELTQPFGLNEVVPEPIRAQAFTLGQQLEATLEDMRSTIFSRTKARVQRQQARFRQFVEGQLNANIRAQLVLANALGIELPTQLLNRLAENADVDSILLSPPLELELSDSAKSVNAHLFWSLAGTGPSWFEAAVIDTGVNFNMSPSNGLPNDKRGAERNWVGNDNFDDIGHGTAVAGIIASTGGSTDNEGIANGIDSIINARVVTDVGPAFSGGTVLDEAIEWAINNGADAINMSLKTADDIIGANYSSHAKIIDFYVDTTSTPFVKSAGNMTSGLTEPGEAYNIITVGNIRNDGSEEYNDDERIASSSFDTYPSRRLLHLMAPGQAINTSWKNGGFQLAGPDDEGGTSYAAPHVTGGIALLASVMPAVPRQVKAVLINTATDQFNPPMNPQDVKGWDAYYGYGYLNMNRAYNARYFRKSRPISIGESKYFKTNLSSASDLGKVTLVWNKHLSSITSPYNLSHLDLILWDYTDNQLGQKLVEDTSAENNVKQLLKQGSISEVLVEVKAIYVYISGPEWFTLASNSQLTEITSPAPAAVSSNASAESEEIDDELGNNFPNPFNPDTWIPFAIAKDTDVKVSIYNAKGQLVRILNLGHKPAGRYFAREKAAYWDGRNSQGERVASGTYYYYLEAGSFKATRKMAIQK